MQLVTMIALLFVLTGKAAACPLQGTWDSGFVPTGFGHSFLRLQHEFDCNGNTRLTAAQVRGKMLQPMSEVIERSGTYTLGRQVPGEPGMWEIDVRVSAITKRYLDPSNVEITGSGCHPADVRILEAFDLQGKNCDRATYPVAGQIERAVVRIDGDKLYWSFFHGDKKLMIQNPTDAPQRHTAVDPNLVFIRR